MSTRGGEGPVLRISGVARRYGIHPQTLRLYERQGLLSPSRSRGNTRLYTRADLERLEVILNLTRDLGVNLAGVEVILHMRQRLAALQGALRQLALRGGEGVGEAGSGALVPVDRGPRLPAAVRPPTRT